MNRLCIVTALAAESRPFLDQWQFKAQKNRHLRVYASEKHLLLQTGMGKLKAAASVGALLQANPDVNAIVNVGIAGGTSPIGSLLMAHEIKDEATGKQWFPHLPNPHDMHDSIRSLATTAVQTHDKPERKYCDGAVFDMEASGIYSAATAYLSTHQIHSLKVISDNSQQPVEQLQALSTRQIANVCEQLINDQFTHIEHMIKCIEQTCTEPNAEQLLWVKHTSQTILQHVHHTQSDEIILRRLLEKLHALEISPELDTCVMLKQAQAIRNHLENQLACATISYGCD